MNSVYKARDGISTILFWMFAVLIGGTIALAGSYFLYLHWRGLLPTFAILAFWLIVALLKWDGK